MSALTLKLPIWQPIAKRLRIARRRRECRLRNADKIRAIATLERELSGEPVSIRETFTAIDTLLAHLRSARCSEDCLVGQRALALDRQEMHEALARARLGQMEDCAIHLGRGLPPEFRGIADALERHLERSR